jgi:hypothetical protein
LEASITVRADALAASVAQAWIAATASSVPVWKFYFERRLFIFVVVRRSDGKPRTNQRYSSP